ncbi:MAG: hypothetical protein AABZ67_04695 [Pseudomonadota bacterium]
MGTLHIAFLIGAFALTSSVADAQTSVRVRGTITAFDGNVLSVKSREGKELKIALAERVTVTTVRALELSDIKPGTGIGTTAVKRADGALVARGVQVFAADRGVPNEGHRPWDLEPGSTMTNAAVSTVVQSAEGREMTLSYKGGSQILIVPEGVPIVTAAPGDRSMLTPGEYVLLTAETGADGGMITQRIQVSKDGVRPPQ